MRIRLKAFGTAVLPLYGLTLAVPASAVGPFLEVELRDVVPAWSPDAAGGQHPTMVTYDGNVVVRGSGTPAEDVWAAAPDIDLSQLNPDIASNVILEPALRLTGRPIKARLLRDAGGPQVRDARLGPDLRFGQGTSPDPYFWAALPAGTHAVDGETRSVMVVNAGGSIVYPDREPSGDQGVLSWERSKTIRNLRSVAVDPTSPGLMLDGEMIIEADLPFLRVDGGDLTAAATAPPLALELPPDAEFIGSLAVHPVGLPGVDIELRWTFPDAPASRHLAHLSVKATPDVSWPESAGSGGLREWMFRPHVIHYGIRRSAGADMAVTIDARVPAGHAVSALDAKGRARYLEPLDTEGVLKVETVRGEQRLTLTPLVPTGRAVDNDPSVSGAAAPRLAKPVTKPASAAFAVDDPSVFGSPELRNYRPAGHVRGSFETRDGVPLFDDLFVDDLPYGALTLPTIRVDGTVIPITPSVLREPPTVRPFGFGDAAERFFGVGFDLSFVVEAENMLVDVLLHLNEVTYDGTSRDQAHLYVLDVHPLDGVGRTVEVEWYSRPKADSFVLGAEVPLEVATDSQAASELIQARNGTTGHELNYYNGAPHVAWSDDPNGLRGLFVLVRDHDGPVHDPIAELDGEALQEPIALYARSVISGPGGADPYPRNWITVWTHFVEPL